MPEQPPPEPNDRPKNPDSLPDGVAAPDNVIALSAYRDRIGRGKPARRVDVIRGQSNPPQAIQALSGDELYYLLREDDPHEVKDLLAHARAEQMQVVLDFGLWSGDQLSPSRMEEWIAVMAEMPYETVGRWIRGFDIELVALLIRKGARVYDLEIEDPPDEPLGLFFPTPDRLFVLDVTGYRSTPDPLASSDSARYGEAEERRGSDEGDGGDGEGGATETVSAHALIEVLENLYRADANLARRILVGAKAELDSQLEEMALRWRQGRMADLGFVDALEALEVYRPLDPTTVHIGELRPGTRVRPQSSEGAGEHAGTPEVLRASLAVGDDLAQSSYFMRALARVTSRPELEELHFGLVALTNRVLSADRVDPGDGQAVAASLVRMRATLDLAVEFLARGAGRVVDDDRAVDAIRTVSVVRLFRLGVSLVGKVRALARTLSRSGPFAALEHLDLVEEPEATVLKAVNRARPLYPSLLDDPPASGERPFSSLADIARATAAIERAAVAQAMLLALGVRPEDLVPESLEGVEPADPVEIDTGVLARTALLLLVASDEASIAPRATAPHAPRFRPLTPDELARFRPARPAGKQPPPVKRTKRSPAPTREPGGSSEVVLTRARRILEQVSPPRLAGSARDMASRWLESLSPLQAVLVRPKPGSRRRRPPGG